VVIANEEKRLQALGLVQRLREADLRVDYPLTPAKVGKQFQTAEQLGALHAVLVGEEWPQVKLKTLATRAEELLSTAELITRFCSAV
jgi:histidyl-tRNA synthetase